MRLSHSMVSKYTNCAKEYEYYYVKKIRSKNKSAALLFGSAVDLAFTAILNKSNEDPITIFDKNWHFQRVGKDVSYLPTCTEIVYSKADFDKDLLSEEALFKMSETLEKEITLDLIEKAIKQKDYVGYNFLPEDIKVIINLASWHVLYAKGLLMIKALNEDIMPNITEVLGTQVQVNLSNEEGDTIIGFVDLVARWKDLKDPVIFDLKTSSIIYEADSVKKSAQLSLYTHALSEEFNTRTAGYLVLSKRVTKNRVKVCSKCGNDGSGGRHKTCAQTINEIRCNGEFIETISPKCETQVIINEIPQRTEDIVLDNYEHVNNSIKHNVFPRNLNNCHRGYGPCDYVNLCYNDSMEGLEQNE